MGQLRTGNKRHNRALALTAARKKTAALELPVAKPVEVAAS